MSNAAFITMTGFDDGSHSPKIYKDTINQKANMDGEWKLVAFG
jgi:hypothetical protein